MYRESDEKAQRIAAEVLVDLKRRLVAVDAQYAALQVREVGGVRIITLPTVPTATLAVVAELYTKKPLAANNCFQVAEYVIDTHQGWDSIQSKEKGELVNGNHCLNIGDGCLIDLEADAFFLFTSDVLVLPLPTTGPKTLDSYLTLAYIAYGGVWQYMGQAGHEQLHALVASARDEWGVDTN